MSSYFLRIFLPALLTRKYTFNKLFSSQSNWEILPNIFSQYAVRLRFHSFVKFISKRNFFNSMVVPQDFRHSSRLNLKCSTGFISSVRVVIVVIFLSSTVSGNHMEMIFTKLRNVKIVFKYGGNHWRLVWFYLNKN